MIPADTAVVGGDEHRPRRPEHLEQAAEMGVGDGEGADVLVAVPAVVMTHEIGQSEVHQGEVVATLGERRDRSIDQTSILVGVVATVDHEPMLRRVSLDNGVERRPVHEHRRGATGSTTGLQERCRVGVERDRRVVAHTVGRRIDAAEHGRVNGERPGRLDGASTETRRPFPGQGGQRRHRRPGDMAGRNPVDRHHQNGGAGLHARSVRLVSTRVRHSSNHGRNPRTRPDRCHRDRHLPRRGRGR